MTNPPYAFRLSPYEDQRYIAFLDDLIRQELNNPKAKGLPSRATALAIKRLIDQCNGWEPEAQPTASGLDYDAVRDMIRTEVRAMLEGLNVNGLPASMLDQVAERAMDYDEVDEDLLSAILHDFSQT